MENLSGEDRKVDGNELVSYHLHYRIRFEGKEEEKNTKSVNLWTETGQGMICLVGTGESRLWRNEPWGSEVLSTWCYTVNTMYLTSIQYLIRIEAV